MLQEEFSKSISCIQSWNEEKTKKIKNKDRFNLTFSEFGTCDLNRSFLLATIISAAAALYNSKRIFFKTKEEGIAQELL